MLSRCLVVVFTYNLALLDQCLIYNARPYMLYIAGTQGDAVSRTVNSKFFSWNFSQEIYKTERHEQAQEGMYVISNMFRARNFVLELKEIRKFSDVT